MRLSSAILAALLLSAAGPAQPAPAPAAQTVTVGVHGLVCDFCARSIEAMFRRRKDVASVHVDLARGEVRLALRPGATLSDAELTRLMRDSGYAVSGIARAPRP
jgi:cation transport ATPase